MDGRESMANEWEGRKTSDKRCWGGEALVELSG
jgi:hypothetical protein